MEVLTNANMPKFVQRLRRLLTGRSFTFQSSGGHIHANVALKSVSDISTWENGLWYTQVDMDGVVQPFTSYFAAPDGKPLVEDVQMCRVLFAFADQSLLVKVEHLAPEMRGHVFTICFVY
jgi:hypothetical protein